MNLSLPLPLSQIFLNKTTYNNPQPHMGLVTIISDNMSLVFMNPENKKWELEMNRLQREKYNLELTLEKRLKEKQEKKKETRNY